MAKEWYGKNKIKTGRSWVKSGCQDENTGSQGDLQPPWRFSECFYTPSRLAGPKLSTFSLSWALNWLMTGGVRKTFISILWSMVEEPQHMGSGLFRNCYLSFLLECLLETLRSFACKFPDKGHIVSPDGIIRLNACYDAILYRRNRKQAHKTAGSSQAQR